MSLCVCTASSRIIRLCAVTTQGTQGTQIGVVCICNIQVISTFLCCRLGVGASTCTLGVVVAALHPITDSSFTTDFVWSPFFFFRYQGDAKDRSCENCFVCIVLLCMGNWVRVVLYFFAFILLLWILHCSS